ncbi:MAG: RnfABCDGE type electron transport complex subunit B [Candidatus Omnitrophica bacterium]|nr:RnfABCDGE type electron transport complex subunit B [Candidatus Omnitrophota bacterium]
MIVNLLIPIAAMALLGLIFGVALAYALKLFGIEADPAISLITSALPGSNCGACGKAGCAGFAQALKKGEAMPSGCAVSNEEARISIAKILGIDYNPGVKTIAAVLCNGGTRARNKYVYRGIRNCKAASLVFGGHKACAFGCLEFGDCVDLCPFDAVTIAPDGLPVVDAHKCTACGKCVAVCPKKLFELIPADKLYYVKCSSKDAGAVVAKACSAGCIACRKCEKACPSSAVKVENNLSKIDYGKCQNMGKCFEVCPTKAIVRRSIGSVTS